MALTVLDGLRCVRRLEGNNIGAEGAAALAKVLPKTDIAFLACAAPVDAWLRLRPSNLHPVAFGRV